MTTGTARIPGTAWVTGGGSGIGRATAIRLATEGHPVAVSGRRTEQLAETVDAVTAAGGRAVAVEMDVTDDRSVEQAHERVRDLFGEVDVLVCSAGGNVRNRWWSDLTPPDFARVVDTNLTSVVRGVHAVLPGMRERGRGTVVVVSSWAGWTYMSAAGAAYSASKTALGQLVSSLNDQEGRHGVRATLLCPGEVGTAILQTRPQPPSDEDIERMLDPDDVAATVSAVLGLPPTVCVNELVVTPTWNRMYIDSSAYRPEGSR